MQFCDNNNHTYQVLNPIPGKSISWSVSPTSLFSGSTSGTGSMATLKKATNAHGRGTITFTLSESGCDPVILTRNITVGIPDYMELDVEDNLGNKVLKTCETVFGEALYNGDAGITEYEWSLISYSGSWYIESTYSASVPYTDVEIDYYHPLPLPGTETVRIRAKNTCGWSWQQETYWTVEDHCNLLGKSQKNKETNDLENHHLENVNVSLHPTLAHNEVRIDWKEGYEGGNFQVSIMDRNGRLVKQYDHMKGARDVFQVSDLNAGMYFVRIDYKESVVWKRVVIVK